MTWNPIQRGAATWDAATMTWEDLGDTTWAELDAFIQGFWSQVIRNADRIGPGPRPDE